MQLLLRLLQIRVVIATLLWVIAIVLVWVILSSTRGGWVGTGCSVGIVSLLVVVVLLLLLLLRIGVVGCSCSVVAGGGGIGSSGGSNTYTSWLLCTTAVLCVCLWILLAIVLVVCSSTLLLRVRCIDFACRGTGCTCYCRNIPATTNNRIWVAWCGTGSTDWTRIWVSRRRRRRSNSRGSISTTSIASRCARVWSHSSLNHSLDVSDKQGV